MGRISIKYQNSLGDPNAEGYMKYNGTCMYFDDRVICLYYGIGLLLFTATLSVRKDSQ